MADPSAPLPEASARPTPTTNRRDVLKWSGLSLLGGSTVPSRAFGAPTAADQTQENTLTVTKDGTDRGRAAFAVTVSGDITPAADSEATIVGSSAIDWVGPNSGTDTLHFSGEITRFLFKGIAAVRLNGAEVDPEDLGSGGGGNGQGTGDPSNTLTVTKEGSERGLGAFAVTVSGALESTASSEAVVRGSSAVDWVGPHSGTDELRYSGEITRFLFKGKATVLVNGEETDPGSLGSTRSGLERIGPASEVTVAPGSTVLFEVAAADDVDPDDVRFEAEDQTQYADSEPFLTSYHAITGNLAFDHTFDSAGTYAASAAADGGSPVRWSVHVRDDGVAPPAGEFVSPDSMDQVRGEEPVEVTARARANGGRLGGVIWWLGMADDVLGVSAVRGEEATATHIVEAEVCEDCPLCIRVVTESGVVNDFHCLEGGSS